MTTFTIAEVTGLSKPGSDQPFNVRATASYTGTDQTFDTRAHPNTETAWGDSFTFSPSESGATVHLTFYEQPDDGPGSELVAGDVDIAQVPAEVSIALAEGVQARIVLASSSVAASTEEEEEEESPAALPSGELAPGNEAGPTSTGSKSPPLSKAHRPREKVSADRNREKAQLIGVDYDDIHAKALERAHEIYAKVLHDNAPNLLDNEKRVAELQPEAPK